MRVWSLDLEDPLEKGMATHSIILAWKIPNSSCLSDLGPGSLTCMDHVCRPLPSDRILDWAHLQSGGPSSCSPSAPGRLPPTLAPGSLGVVRLWVDLWYCLVAGVSLNPAHASKQTLYWTFLQLIQCECVICSLLGSDSYWHQCPLGLPILSGEWSEHKNTFSVCNEPLGGTGLFFFTCPCQTQRMNTWKSKWLNNE